MAEPKSMEEGLKAYQDGKFSRQSLFELVVARIKATEANLERLEEQYRVMVSAMVRGAQEAPPEPPQAKQSQSEKMKKYWADRKAADQAIADGIGGAANG